MGCGSVPAFFTEAMEVESEGVWSPRCVTSPARGPVLPAHLWPAPCASAAGVRVLPPMGRLMSTHASVLVDSVGPPSAEICRAAASFP
jgi:hypothetical protein